MFWISFTPSLLFFDPFFFSFLYNSFFLKSDFDIFLVKKNCGVLQSLVSLGYHPQRLNILSLVAPLAACCRVSACGDSPLAVPHHHQLRRVRQVHPLGLQERVHARLLLFFTSFQTIETVRYRPASQKIFPGDPWSPRSQSSAAHTEYIVCNRVGV